MSKKSKQAAAPAPVTPENLDMQKIIKSTGLRVGLPLLGVWLIAIIVGNLYGLIAAGVITLIAAGFVYWAFRQVKKSQNVANILSSADVSSKEGREEAMKKLDETAAKGDVASIFAKAQLLMHESPREAQKVLEGINLEKVMAPIADEARGQRAMIHLLFGEVDQARVLVDGIDLSRHDQIKSRAALAAVVAEAWARTGLSTRALETLDNYDLDNEELMEIKPQLLRARAFATAGKRDVKRMRFALRQLNKINPQLLAGFLEKKVHPLLAKEAKKMLMQSGAVPKKMVRRRM